MTRIAAAALACALSTLPAAAPVAADEFTDTLDGALEAYRAGDYDAARDDLDYALKLLNDLKAAGLADFLPAAQPGWTRTENSETASLPIPMLGGGSTASASYTDGTAEFTLTLVANSPMISGMAAMMSGLATMGGGQTIRIQRETFQVTDGEIQGVVNGKVLVSISGDAPVEAKRAHLESMDLRALGAF
jgi:hypothetical protein